MEQMNVGIEVLKYPTEEDWMLAKQCASVTSGKRAKYQPDEEWKRQMLDSRHSPIRTLQFCFLLTNVPYWVSVHLVRHVHAQPFVKSQRDDRQSEYKRNEAPQDAPVDMCWYMNAEELMTIANKRLCNQASPETRHVIKLICLSVLETNPEFEGFLVPMCAYRGGRCGELRSCGKNESWRQ